jgi:N utilization substance protein A
VIRSIDLDEEKRSVKVTVEEEELAKAIGRRGQNARLTARLVGWDIQVEKDESVHEAFEARVEAAAQALIEPLGLEESKALELVRGGITNIEMLATSVDAEDIAGIIDVPEAEAAIILEKAKEIYQPKASETAPADEDAAKESESAGEETETSAK